MAGIEYTTTRLAIEQRKVSSLWLKYGSNIPWVVVGMRAPNVGLLNIFVSVRRSYVQMRHRKGPGFRAICSREFILYALGVLLNATKEFQQVRKENAQY